MENFLKTIGALNDETRIKLLKFLSIEGECCICDLENSFGMIHSRLSRHLKILKEAGFLTLRRDGKWANYSISKELGNFHKNALENIAKLDIDLPISQKACKGTIAC